MHDGWCTHDGRCRHNGRCRHDGKCMMEGAYMMEGAGMMEGVELIRVCSDEICQLRGVPYCGPLIWIQIRRPRVLLSMKGVWYVDVDGWKEVV